MSETGEKKYFCFCSSNCKYETMTKEQIMAAIAQATGVTDVDPDAGFISKVKETNGRYVTFWVGSRAQYNALQVKEENCLYIITDDTTKADIEKMVADLQKECQEAKSMAAAAAAGGVRFVSWDTTLENNGSSTHECGGTVAMVVVTARYKNAGAIMTGVWTPATSGMVNHFYGYLGANESLDKWSTAVTIDGSNVTVTRGAAGSVTYYCTAMVI
jgi:hypothetical protein